MTEDASWPDRAARIDRAVRRLELLVTRRLDTLRHGPHAGVLPGLGQDPGEHRVYEPGDDVRMMDWAVTARTQVPHVRVPVPEHNVDTWLLVDVTAGLAFGTATHTKFELAVAAAAAIGFLTTRAGNRLGALLLHGGWDETIPPRAGRRATHALLERIAAAPLDEGGGDPDLASGIGTVARMARRRGVVAVVSDFLCSSDWPASLRPLALHHRVLAVEVIDPRELALPDVGVLTLVDPRTGRLREVQTASQTLRRRYAMAAQRQREHFSTAIRAAGASHLVLRTDRDWLLDIVRFLERGPNRRIV